jgi:hypothetical protein
MAIEGKKGTVVPVLNLSPRHEDVLGSRGIAPRIHRRQSGPQSRSGRSGEEKNSQPPSEIEP